VQRLGPLIVLVLIAAACGSGSGDSTGSSAPGKITEAELGEEWPFTVSEGILRCHGSAGFGAVTFEADGTEYAVNGVAKGQDYPPVDPVWADDPTVDGLKKNIGPVIDRGLDLCA
jgi:hypothetical protein